MRFGYVFFDRRQNCENLARLTGIIMMNRVVTLSVAVIASACLVTAIGAEREKKKMQIDLSKLPPAATKQGVTYAADIKPVFDAACTKCHGEQKPKGHLRLDSLEGALKGGEDGKVVL